MKKIHKPKRHKPTQTFLFMFVAFWATVLVFRGIIFWYVRRGIIPAIFISGYHIHHFVTGFLFLVIASLVALRSRHHKYIPGMIAGVGLALVCDEILYWTFYSFEYWSLVNLAGVVIVGFFLAALYEYTRRDDPSWLLPLHPHMKQWLLVFSPLILSSVLLLSWYAHHNTTAARIYNLLVPGAPHAEASK